MFEYITKEERLTLFIACIINFPEEIEETFEVFRSTWTACVMKLLCTNLQLDEAFVEAYMPMTLHTYVSNQDNFERKTRIMQPFLSSLLRVQQFKIQLYIEVCMILIINGRYDGRGRVFVRNLKNFFCLTNDEAICVEIQIASSLIDFQNALNYKVGKDDNKQSKLVRYGKIGAVAVGAGAILALSGGLAAPAIAGALLVMGSSSAAAAASVVTVATLFGTAGAGLSGYKMIRRTRGIEEFEFEQYDKQGQLAVMIMVSGWIETDEDYKRIFGVLPNDLSFRERLVRYYEKYAPDRLDTINEEIELYEENPEPLFYKLKALYGKDPMNTNDLIAEYHEYPFNTLYNEYICNCLEAKISGSSENNIDTNITSNNNIENNNDGYSNENSDTTKSSSIFNKFSYASNSDKNIAKREAELKAKEIQVLNDMKSKKNVVDDDNNSNTTGSGHIGDKSKNNNVSDSNSNNNNNNNSSTAGKVFSTIGSGFSGMYKVSKSAVNAINPLSGSSGGSGNNGKAIVEDQVATKRSSFFSLSSGSTAAAKSNVTNTNDDKQNNSNNNNDYVTPEVASTPHEFDEEFFVKGYWNWRELEISPMYELYLLRWELNLQKDLGNSIMTMIKNLYSASVQNVLAATVLTTLATAVMWPTILLKMTDVIDSLWTIAIERADQAGKELATALVTRPSGSRPVTLVGYSVGSRVIWSCLKELIKLMNHLYKRKKKRQSTSDDENIDIVSHSNNDEDIISSTRNNDDHVSNDMDNVDNNINNNNKNIETNNAIDDEDDDSDSEAGSLFEGEGVPLMQQQSSTNKNNSDNIDNVNSSTNNNGKSTSKRMFFFSKNRSTSAAGGVSENNKDLEARLNTLTIDEIRGIIQDVVLLGSPISQKSHYWPKIRHLVSGRVINGYSKKDLVLGVIYRYSRFKIGVTGTAPVHQQGIENIDLSSIVEKHVDYCRKMKQILELIDLTNTTTASSYYYTTADTASTPVTEELNNNSTN